jgi:hypothetical protein
MRTSLITGSIGADVLIVILDHTPQWMIMMP